MSASADCRNPSCDHDHPAIHLARLMFPSIQLSTTTSSTSDGDPTERGHLPFGFMSGHFWLLWGPRHAKNPQSTRQSGPRRYQHSIQENRGTKSDRLAPAASAMSRTSHVSWSAVFCSLGGAAVPPQKKQRRQGYNKEAIRAQVLYVFLFGRGVGGNADMT